MTPRQGAPAPIPVTVLTGFLGAGKTTLLNTLLKRPELSNTAVLVNEFGETPLDHLMIEAIDGDVTMLAGGCLCCVVHDDLLAVLEDLLRRRDNGRIAPFSRLVIETTGLADPTPILQAAAQHPYLRLRYAIDGVVTVVAAPGAARLLAEQPEAARQALLADRIVLSKTQGRGAHELEDAVAAIRRINPSAPVLSGPAADMPSVDLFDIAPLEAEGVARVARWLDMAAVPAHAEGIRSTVLWRDVPLPPPALSLFTDLLSSAYGARILRLKGLLALADDPTRPVVVHGVQHVFEAPRRLDSWPDADRRSRLVVIARDLDADLLARIYDALAGVAAVDRPDAEALLNSPLAPPRGGFFL